MTRDEDERRLEQAMQRGDDLLVDSLHQEDRRRRSRLFQRTLMAVGVVAALALAWNLARFTRTTVGLPRASQSRGPTPAQTTPASAPTGLVEAYEAVVDDFAGQPVAGNMLALKDDNWREAFAVGQRLARMAPDKSWPIVRANWGKVPNFEARQQILKAFAFARLHPRVLDVMHLGMTDPEPQVRAWAVGYLRGLAFQDFAEDSTAYEKWRARTAGRPAAEVVAESATEWVGRLKFAEGADIKRHARFVREVQNDLMQIPAARDSAVKAGVLDVAKRWLREHADDGDIVVGARDLLTALKPDQAYLKNVILPMLDASNPPDVRQAAVQTLGRADNKWAVDPLVALLRESVTSKDEPRRGMIWDVASALAAVGDTRAIPDMIAAIAHDDTYDTVYGVGYFGLSKMTGVRYDESHNGAWWRHWWERERQRFPEPARSTAIPVLDKARAAQSEGGGAVRPIFATMLAAAAAPADANDVPVEQRRAANDEMMRYFLMGPKAKAAPKDGYRLLLVLPGGDGGEDFRPFIQSVAQESVSDQYLVAQLVAPKWARSEQLVWPKEKDLKQGAPIATEAFIDAVVADIATKHKFDPKHVYALGWSSGGPPVYAAAMRATTPLSGAFVAMSVFKANECPPAAGAKGRAFYILHSPQDFIKISFPQAAQRTLTAAGAKVKLTTYQGGHGWHGNPQEMIRTGVTWLESQSKSPTARTTTGPTTATLLRQ